MFCPESMTEQEILNLDDIDIFQSCEFERYWKNAEVSAYLCQMVCAEEELKGNFRKLQNISRYQPVFRSNSCKKIWKMIYFIIMERRKMKKALL